MSALGYLRVMRAVGGRTLRKLYVRPVSLTFSLVQPLAWMLLFGFLFARFPLDTLPPGTRYLDFLAPGVACMSALFGASQSGIEFVRDLQTGFLARLLETPAPRSAILLGKLLADALRLVVQAAVVLLLALLLGARFDVSVGGALLGGAALFTFAFAFAAVSCAIAAYARAPESMAAYVHVVNMPLFFSSTALVPNRAMPELLAEVAEYNPLSLAVEALRAGLVHGRSAHVFETLLPLIAVALLAAALALTQLDRATREA